MPHTSLPDNPLDWRAATSLTAYVDDHVFQLLQQPSTTLRVRDTRDGHETLWSMTDTPSGLVLDRQGSGPAPREVDVLAALEGVFTLHPSRPRCVLGATGPWQEDLLRQGALVPGPDGRLVAHRELLWQLSRLWMPHPHATTPLMYRLSDGRRHPLRGAKPRGVVYRRHIPWLGTTFSFRTVDIGQDLERFNRWMNDPAVAQVWQEEGSLDKHRAYLEAIEADPHMHAMIASLGGEPFAYFEAYWAKENRVGPFCDAADHDRGWHVLVGEPAFRGKAIATAWLTSISHYLFLADPRTQRIVGEPRADHAQQIRNLDRSGYAKVKEFDFPHKRALLVTLLRERYFTDALWWPRAEAPEPTPPVSSARSSA
jgi:acetyl CoA:N6-hydroxylysine acetyl transferase